jgi:hypothetical protein
MALRTSIGIAFVLAVLSWLTLVPLVPTAVPLVSPAKDTSSTLGATLSLSVGWIVVVGYAFRTYGKRAWPVILLPPAAIPLLIFLGWFAYGMVGCTSNGGCP